MKTMPQVSSESLAQAVDPFAQLLVTVLSVGFAVLIVTLAWREMRKSNSCVPVLLITGVFLGALFEPVYDNAFHIHWYTPGQWSLYSAFNTTQPIWITAAYVSTYGITALQIYQRMRRGDSIVSFIAVLAVGLTLYLLFELIFINLGIYEYYGMHPFRLFNFPTWVSLPNLAVATATGVLASLAHTYLRGATRQIIALLAFPICMPGVTFFVGLPTLIAINSSKPDIFILWASAVASTILSLLVIWLLLSVRSATNQAS